MFSQFSKNELVQINELIFKLGMADEESEHSSFVEEYKKLFEFDMFTMTLLHNNCITVLDYFQTDFPVDFMKFYMEQQYFKHDPKWWFLRQNPCFFYWGDAYKFACECPETKKIFADHRDAKIVDGFTCNLRRKSLNVTASFVTKRQIKEKELFRNKCLVRILGNHIVESAFKLFKRRMHKTLKISNKQKEILSLMLSGNSRSEIANILELSPKSIDAHLEEARYKFNVQTRRELLLFANDLLHV